jgi:hypothetical protein
MSVLSLPRAIAVPLPSSPPSVRCEAGVERHVEQPALSARVDDRQARKRRGNRAGSRDVAQVSGPLRHQHVAFGQEGDGPWVRKPVRERLDMDAAGFGGEGPVHRLGASRGEEKERRHRRAEHCGSNHGLSFRQRGSRRVVPP